MNPLLDPRSSGEVLERTRELFQTYFPDTPFPDSESPAGAILRIFSDLTGMLIPRLNRAPEKHRLAFLNFMNAELLPPRPARTAFAFKVQRGTDSIVIPAGTEIGVQGRSAVPFKTNRALQAVPAVLNGVIFVEPALDTFRDLTKIALAGTPFYPGGRTAGMEKKLEHVLFLGLRNLLPPGDRSEMPASSRQASPVRLALFKRKLKTLEKAAKFRVHFKGANLDASFLAHWSLVGENKTPPTRVYRRGDEFIAAFTNFRPPPPSSVGSLESMWLKCEPSTSEKLQGLPAARLPMVHDIRYGFDSPRRRLQFMYANSAALSKNKEFRPLGTHPKAGDAFYLADAAFQWSGALVTLASVSAMPVAPESDAVLDWEYWEGEDWRPLGASSADGRAFPDNSTFQFKDGSRAFTRDGTIRFRCPRIPPGKVNGRESFWLRVVLREGNYGAPEEPSRVKRVRDGLRNIPMELLSAKEKHDILAGVAKQPDAARGKPDGTAPPVLRALKIKYSVRDIAPDELVIRNGFEQNAIGITPNGFAPFQPFHPFIARPGESYLYLGFKPESALPGGVFSLLCAFNPSMPRPGTGPVITEGDAPPSFRPLWEYPGPDRWLPLEIHAEHDIDAVFQRGDIVRFVLPEDARIMSPEPDGKDEPAYWIRIGGDSRAWDQVPLCGGFHPNAVFALNSTMSEKEIIGSSGGRPNLRVRLSRAPVLGLPIVRVREPVLPGVDERESLAGELRNIYKGPPPLPVSREGENGSDFWVAWARVKNFALSRPGDRHFTLDVRTGEITFGDGRKGRMPPEGIRNIRADYSYGGGVGGNVKAGGGVHMGRHLPGIESVSMPIAASGGADREEPSRAVRRAPGMIRTGNRAVTLGDFEELAAGYANSIHRTKCVMQSDGRVLVVVLAGDSADGGPRNPAGPGFLMEVEEYLKAHASFALRSGIRVIGPEFVRIDVSMGVMLSSKKRTGDARKVSADLKKRLGDFLDPFEGGVEGNGPDFGRDISRAETANIILAHPDVVELTSLNMSAYRGGRVFTSPGLIRRETEMPASGRTKIVTTIETNTGGIAAHAPSRT